MEVYEGFGDQAQFLSMLQESVEQSGLLPRLADDGKRHIEVFQCA